MVYVLLLKYILEYISAIPLVRVARNVLRHTHAEWRYSQQ